MCMCVQTFSLWQGLLENRHLQRSYFQVKSYSQFLGGICGVEHYLTHYVGGKNITQSPERD
jgi:hypothetical protein